MNFHYRQDLQTFRLFTAELKHSKEKAKDILPKYLPLMQKQKSQKVLSDFVKSRTGIMAQVTESRDFRNAFDILYINAGIKSGSIGPNTYDRLLDSEVAMSKEGIIHPEVKEAYQEITNLNKNIDGLEIENSKLSSKFEKISNLYKNLVGNLLNKEGMSEDKINTYSNTPFNKAQEQSTQKEKSQMSHKGRSL